MLSSIRRPREVTGRVCNQAPDSLVAAASNLARDLQSGHPVGADHMTCSQRHPVGADHMSLACEGHAIKLLSTNFNLFNIIKFFIIQRLGF